MRIHTHGQTRTHIHSHAHTQACYISGTCKWGTPRGPNQACLPSTRRRKTHRQRMFPVPYVFASSFFAVPIYEQGGSGHTSACRFYGSVDFTCPISTTTDKGRRGTSEPMEGCLGSPPMDRGLETRHTQKPIHRDGIYGACRVRAQC